MASFHEKVSFTTEILISFLRSPLSISPSLAPTAFTAADPSPNLTKVLAAGHPLTSSSRSESPPRCAVTFSINTAHQGCHSNSVGFCLFLLQVCNMKGLGFGAKVLVLFFVYCMVGLFVLVGNLKEVIERDLLVNDIPKELVNNWAQWFCMIHVADLL
ncbi:hypothetical protein RJT34_22946 [Clitoria ternatea]|uniref:Uncharacterized protein n=1 Tax=Clitoria ternatea TaxID=43366 RepID=A0AAN9IG20_CLITE